MSQSKSNTEPSKIEIAKALRHLKAVATSDQYSTIQRMLEREHGDELKRAVAGLCEEDEFVLLCMLMGTSTHLVPLEQRPLIAVERAAPDLLARFQPPHQRKNLPASKHSGFRCVVEVKSTKEMGFKIGGGQLRKLRCFAETFSMPLVFAVRFLSFEDAAVWVIVEDQDRTASTLHVGIGDWASGLRPILWDEEAFMLMPGVYFQINYQLRTRTGGLFHRDYGEQVSFQIVTPDDRMEITEMHGEIAAAFFQSYGLQERQVKRDGDFTSVAYTANNSVLSVADLIYGMNRLSRDENGNLLFDAGTIMRQLADKQQLPLITREFVTYYAQEFCRLGALGQMDYGKPEEAHSKWIATGGQTS